MLLTWLFICCWIEAPSFKFRSSVSWLLYKNYHVLSGYNNIVAFLFHLTCYLLFINEP